MRRLLGGGLAAAVLAGVSLLMMLPAQAASALSAIPVGSGATYHITTQSSSPQKGPQSASHYVNFKLSRDYFFGRLSR
ncbi:MAG: hypothetical protein JOY86_02340 [Candidatus Eremiobacteraeota bacterium]|nr:hypothetical protein [Candidatus Eremiobacteraeota bacterium]